MKNPQLNSTWPESWKLSWHYDQMEIFGGRSSPGYAYAYEERRNVTLEMVRRAMPPPSRVLDLAAGQGNFSLTLAELGYEVTWNDLRSELRGYVELKYEHGNISYLPGNVFDLKVEKLFNTILVGEVVEHVAHPDEFFRQIAKLLAPGGSIVLTTPNGECLGNNLPRFSDCEDPSLFESRQFMPDGDGHIFLLHEDEIRRLSSAAGLEVERLEVVANILTNGYLKTGPLLRILPEARIKSIERLSRRVPWAVRKKVHTAFAAILRKAP